MISLHNNITVAMGTTYFEKDDYYSRHEGPARTEFQGRGAELLGISGKFDPDIFQNLLEGYSPDGLDEVVRSKQKKLSEKTFEKTLAMLEQSLAGIKDEDRSAIAAVFKDTYRGFHLDTTERKAMRQQLSKLTSAMALPAEVKKKVRQGIGRALEDITQEHRRPAYDVTFSAPKSLSLAALLNNDQEILKAHAKAVQYALDQLEERCAGALVGLKNERMFEKTGNIIAAKFTHGTSREQDPQLHTHCVIINRTRRKDGQWRSIANTEIWQQQKLLGALYQNKLAELAQKAGYGLDIHKDGTFDLKGYEKEHLQHFSKRRSQVIDESARILFERELRFELEAQGLSFQEVSKDWRVAFEVKITQAKAQELGFSVLKSDGDIVTVQDFSDDRGFKRREDYFKTLVTKEVAKEGVLRNRARKSETTYTELKQRWQEEAVKIGLEHPVKNRQRHDLEWGKAISLTFTESHLRERLATFSTLATEFQTVAHNLGRASFEDMAYHLGHDDIIIKTDHQHKGSLEPYEVRTSLRQLAMEEANLNYVAQGSGRYRPIDKGASLAEMQRRYGLNDGQALGVQSVLTSRDRVVGWEGVAGSGKSYACRVVKDLASKAGYAVSGFGPDGSSVKAFASESMIPSKTIHKHLASKPWKSAKPKLWIVDEASKISTELMYRFLERAQKEDARVLLIGDPRRQLGAVGAGSPFKQMIESGKIVVAQLSEHRRQKDEVLKKAVESASLMTNRGLKASVEHLNPHIVEKKRRATRIQAVVTEYLKLPAGERGRTLILADLNEDRLALTERLRRGLKATGEIGPTDIALQTLKDKELTEAQKSLARYYEKGDVIVSQQDAGGLLKAGVPYQVVGIHRASELITLSDGKIEISVFPSKMAWSVYTQEAMSVAEGDVLRWRRNHEGRVNNETVTVVEAGPEGIKLQSSQTKETWTIDPWKPQHLDYGLVMTTYSSQGHTRDKGLLLAESNVSMNSWYTGLSRFRESVKVFTDNKAKLSERILRSAVKENALEKMDLKSGWDEAFRAYKPVQLTVPLKSHGKSPQVSLPIH